MRQRQGDIAQTSARSLQISGASHELQQDATCRVPGPDLLGQGDESSAHLLNQFHDDLSFFRGWSEQQSNLDHWSGV